MSSLPVLLDRDRVVPLRPELVEQDRDPVVPLRPHLVEHGVELLDAGLQRIALPCQILTFTPRGSAKPILRFQAGLEGADMLLGLITRVRRMVRSGGGIRGWRPSRVAFCRVRARSAALAPAAFLPRHREAPFPLTNPNPLDVVVGITSNDVDGGDVPFTDVVRGDVPVLRAWTGGLSRGETRSQPWYTATMPMNWWKSGSTRRTRASRRPREFRSLSPGFDSPIRFRMYASNQTYRATRSGTNLDPSPCGSNSTSMKS